MKNSLKKYLPIAEHREALVERCILELHEWTTGHGQGVLDAFAQNMALVLADAEGTNPDFETVHLIGLWQTAQIGLAVLAAHGNRSSDAHDRLAALLGGFSIQIPLDLHCYQQSLAMYGQDGVCFGQDLKRMLLHACAALWLGPADLARAAHDWLYAYRKNAHLAEYDGDACFLEFTLWMLATEVAGSVQLLEQDRSVYGPYLPLIDGFQQPGLLTDEVYAAADFHLYRSDDFPKADPFPSFYGEVLGSYPAEIFAFAALRKRLTGYATALGGHPLLHSGWQNVAPVVVPIDPPLAEDIRQRFGPVFS